MIRAMAVTVSNRAAAGVYADKSGPVLVELLEDLGCQVDGPVVVPDGEPVAGVLRDAVTQGYDVVVTSGGTGLTPTDRTPEMTRLVIEREVPGASELTEQQLAEIARTSNTAVQSLGVPYNWVTSYVAGDKIYCVHEADDEETIREHARRGGFPADMVSASGTSSSHAVATMT